MDASIILRKYILTEALLHIEIFTEPFDPILWKAWAVRMHVLLVFMVQAQSEAASVGIILPLLHDIPVLAQVEIHLATAHTMEGSRRMIPRIADHLPAVIPHGLTARILYDDPTVREDFGLGHPPDGLPDIGTLHLQVETLHDAACGLYYVMLRIIGRCELADGTLRGLQIGMDTGHTSDTTLATRNTDPCAGKGLDPRAYTGGLSKSPRVSLPRAAPRVQH
ncbi:hypothetical protein SCP_0310370 [Sparassis crispa]|uniref:Uncharacterized protein n=1 Tax=Sparassis crispa TaxID=139825 RepID=A0A401GGK0_9APHY|nr:hypothetical protein SCP_0310370 [Sparassis crispa]GBE81310.1 hypothetical protein SCP_0310370 [Sparassis crispa]